MINEIVGYENLHRHTERGSLLDGFATVQEYAEYSKKANQQYLCITDHGMMSAVPEQIKYCDKYGINPIFGVELYVNPMQVACSSEEERSKYIKSLDPDSAAIMKKRGFHLLAIATSLQGYSNLVKLSSWGWLKGFYYKPRVNHEQLMKHKEGIIFTSCCYASEIGQAFDKGGEDAGNAMIEKYIAMFGKENFYLEIMLLDFVKQKPYNIFIIKASEKYGLKLILSNDCFVKDTIITTKKGSVFIQDIQVGDEVLTHNRNWKKVQYVNSRELNNNERVFRVKTSKGSYAFDATGNHPVRIAIIGKENKNRKKIDSFEWKQVKDLSIGDYLVVPKIKDDYLFSQEDKKNIDLLDYVSQDSFNNSSRASVHFDYEKECFISSRGFSENKIIIPRFIDLDDDFCKLLGLYLAEGGLDINGTCVSFGLHNRETEEMNLIVKIFSKYNISIYKSFLGEGMKGTFSSVVFRQFFENLCGAGCSNKTLSNLIGKLSKKQMILVLGQYFKGDGYFPKIHDRGSNITSVSKKLIFDVSMILNSLGILSLPCFNDYTNSKHKNPNANPKNWKKSYYLSSGANNKILLKNILFGLNEEIQITKTNRGKLINNEDCYVIKIENITEINYSDRVYNLQVEDDESYLANFYAVHNCHYCYKEDSEYQRLMMMIQSKKTIEDIQKALLENDLQDVFELQDTNLWMKTEEELNEKWEKDYKDVIDYDIFKQSKLNTVEICRRAKGVKLDRSMKLPKFDNANEKLYELVMNGFKDRNLPKTRKYLDRLKEEFSLITHKEFSSYFLIQKQMCDEAKRICRIMLGWGDGNEAYGPGRGSCGGSLICYCLGITDVNPIKHDLLFSRFLSEARGGKSLVLRFKKEPIETIISSCTGELQLQEEIINS